MPNTTDTIAPPQRLADHGPLYTETPTELKTGQPFPGGIAEPWNATTAFFFVLIVVYWVVRLRGRLKDYPFLAVTLPILFVGGVGGTLYHGLRNWSGFFWMDVLPIYFLGLFLSVYFWIRLGPRVRHLVAMIAVLVLLQLLGMWQLPHHWSIQLSYAMLAMLILIPIGVVLIRTRARHAGWVVTSLISFGIAWFFRIADPWDPPLLPMGTHWLWHTFGAVTTLALSTYVFSIEGVNLKSATTSNQPTSPRIGSA